MYIFFKYRQRPSISLAAALIAFSLVSWRPIYLEPYAMKNPWPPLNIVFSISFFVAHSILFCTFRAFYNPFLLCVE